MKIGLNFGLSLFEFGSDELKTLAQTAEQLGYASIWHGDHLILPTTMPARDATRLDLPTNRVTAENARPTYPAHSRLMARRRMAPAMARKTRIGKYSRSRLSIGTARALKFAATRQSERKARLPPCRRYGIDSALRKPDVAPLLLRRSVPLRAGGGGGSDGARTRGLRRDRPAL